jgi:2-amino-4-hydroxy-6-hydroxymethyldihydropteridine diphosphokinase
MPNCTDPCFRPSRAYIGVGSNLGDRLSMITEAARRLANHKCITEIASARVYETVPVGEAGTEHFYNTVFALDVCLTPMGVLEVLQGIEADLGRATAPRGSASGTRLGPRTIDLDLLFYEDLVFQNDELTIPHPFLHQREFVLRPLCDLAPQLCHPELGLSMHDLLTALPPSGTVLGVVATLPFFERSTSLA